MQGEIYHGDASQICKYILPEESVHIAMTSPPYWGLRDYGIAPVVWGGWPTCGHTWTPSPHPPQHRTGDTNAGRCELDDIPRDAMPSGEWCRRCPAWKGSLGTEPTLQLYVEHLMGVLAGVWQVLRTDGTLWINLGDVYYSRPGKSMDGGGLDGRRNRSEGTFLPHQNRLDAKEFKPKDLVGMPWAVMQAMRSWGWWYRQTIIWDIPDIKPESVKDRPAKGHEYVLLFSKSQWPYYDAEATRVPSKTDEYDSALLRTVWTIPTSDFDAAQVGMPHIKHHALFPPELARAPIAAGSSARGVCAECGAPWHRKIHLSRNRKGQPRRKTGPDTWEPSCQCDALVVPATVLDPFNGCGSTGVEAIRQQRHYIGIEAEEDYCEVTRRRLQHVPMFNPLEA